MTYEVNAVITDVTISNDNHGLLTAWIHLDYGGVSQGFWGYVLYLPSSFTHAKASPNYAGHFIWRIMQVADVAEWSKLKGKTIRVRKDDSWNSSIEAIGHIVKDDWFNPKIDFAAMEGEQIPCPND